MTIKPVKQNGCNPFRQKEQKEMIIEGVGYALRSVTTSFTAELLTSRLWSVTPVIMLQHKAI